MEEIRKRAKTLGTYPGLVSLWRRHSSWNINKHALAARADLSRSDAILGDLDFLEPLE
jgi:hypothetical protein